MPADGDREGFNLLGVPMMMEYDTPTRSWKLVVDTELDTVIVVSGTVSLEAGDLEIGAVEIKDATTDQRAIVNALGQLHVFITGSSLGSLDTELPPAIAAGDAMANPVAPQVLSNLLAFNGIGWDRVRIDSGFQLQVTLISGAFPAGETLPVSVAAMNYDPQGRLETVATVSGTVAVLTSDIEIGAVEVKDAATDDRQRVTADGRAWVNSYITGTVSVDSELPVAVVLSEGMGNPTPPAVGSFNMGWNGADWDRLIVDSERRLETRAFVTGSVSIDGTVDTELPAAVVLSDGMGNPTPPAVGSFNMVWNGADWDRLRKDPGVNIFTTLISGAFPAGETLPVSLASLPDLVATEDEVTAYVTGTVTTRESDGLETYRVVFNGLTNPIGTVVAILGAADKTLRVTQVQIAKPSVAQSPLQIRKYSTAITSGTFTTPTPVPLDSNNAAAVGVVNLYTLPPVNGTLVGALFDADLATGDILYETFGEQQNAQPVVLRGVNQYLSVETAATGTFAGFVEWTEE